MDAQQLYAIRISLDLTQGEASRLFGVEERTWRRYEGGTRAIPKPVARLLLLVEQMPGALEELKLISQWRPRRAPSATTG